MFKALLTVFLLAAVAQCAIVPSEEEPSLELRININWQGILQCLKEASPYAPDVIQLIDLIKKKDYNKAFLKAIDLIKNGSQVVIKCAGYLKNKTVNLTFDWQKAAECLVKFAASSGPAIVALVQAIASKDVTAIISAATKVITAIGGIPSQCQKFW